MTNKESLDWAHNNLKLVDTIKIPKEEWEELKTLHLNRDWAKYIDGEIFYRKPAKSGSRISDWEKIEDEDWFFVGAVLTMKGIGLFHDCRYEPSERVYYVKLFK